MLLAAASPLWPAFVWWLVPETKGKTLEEAGKITNAQIADELALPPVKIHCSILAEDAVKAAIADYRAKQHTAEQDAKKE